VKDATDITIILDRSGSMAPLADEVVSGFNKFLEEQKENPTPATITLVTFADDVKEVETAPLAEYPPMLPKDYRPGGMTALNDAMTRAIVATGRRLEKLPEDERPDKVVILVITDGHENASQESTTTGVRMLIEHQTKLYNWRFVYLGANVDAFAEGSQRGMAAGNVANYSANAGGLRAAYNAVSTGLAGVRSGEVKTSSGLFDKVDRSKLVPGGSIVNPNLNPTSDGYKNSKP